MDVNQFDQAELAQDSADWALLLQPLVEATRAPSNEPAPMAQSSQLQEMTMGNVDLFGEELASTPTEVQSMTQVNQPHQPLEPQSFLQPQQALMPREPCELQQEDWINQLAIDAGINTSQFFGVSESLPIDSKWTAGLSYETGNTIGVGVGVSTAEVKNKMTQLSQNAATTLAQRQNDEQIKKDREALRKEREESAARTIEMHATINKLKEDHEQLRSELAHRNEEILVILQSTLAQQAQQSFDPQVLQAQTGFVWPQQQQQDWNNQMFFQPQQFLPLQQFVPQQQLPVQNFDFGMIPTEQPATIDPTMENEMPQAAQPQPEQSQTTSAQQPSPKRKRQETETEQTDEPVRGYRKHKRPRAPRPDFSKRKLEYEDA